MIYFNLKTYRKVCPFCGEAMSGDGFTVVLHCPGADPDSYQHSEPDAQPVYCAGGAE